MKPPKTVKVGALTYALIIDDEAIGKRSLEQEESLLGYCDIPGQTVTVKKSQGPDSLALTIVHETFGHALIDAAGLGRLFDGNAEEDFCRAIEAPLLELLRNNAALITYLVEG